MPRASCETATEAGLGWSPWPWTMAVLTTRRGHRPDSGRGPRVMRHQPTPGIWTSPETHKQDATSSPLCLNGECSPGTLPRDSFFGPSLQPPGQDKACVLRKQARASHTVGKKTYQTRRGLGQPYTASWAPPRARNRVSYLTGSMSLTLQLRLLPVPPLDNHQPILWSGDER